MLHRGLCGSTRKVPRRVVRRWRQTDQGRPFLYDYTLFLYNGASMHTGSIFL